TEPVGRQPARLCHRGRGRPRTRTAWWRAWRYGNGGRASGHEGLDTARRLSRGPRAVDRVRLHTVEATASASHLGADSHARTGVADPLAVRRRGTEADREARSA